MSTPQQRSSTLAEVIEAGDAAFFYRPIAGVDHPQTSDDLAHVFLALFCDDQSRHQNRILTFQSGYFPPVIPDLDLPEEREWAYVSAVRDDPRQIVETIVSPEDGTSVARFAGDGRYIVVRQGGQSYFVYLLRRPRRLGHAQQTLLMERQASFRVVVQEPSVPTPLCLTASPTYPPELANRFDGRVSIPLDPSDFLDYPWTQVLFIGDRTDPEVEFSIKIAREAVNQPASSALRMLESAAARIRMTTGIDILQPAIEGALV